MRRTRIQNNTALLMIDVQVGMFEGPDGPVYEPEYLLAKVESLIRKARESETPVIYVQHCESAGELFEPNTRNWFIHPSIAPLNGDPIIQKRTPDSFHETTLHKELESRGVGRLVLTGMQTENCIDTTCRRAFSLGYEVVLVEDAHSTWDTENLSAPEIIAHHNEVLGGWFSEVVEADSVTLAGAHK